MAQTLIAKYDAYKYFVLPIGIRLTQEGQFFSPDAPGWWYVRGDELIYRDEKGDIATVQSSNVIIETKKPVDIELTD